MLDSKEMAARRALDFVQDGMRLGLGTGSTTAIFLHLLGDALQQGRLRKVTGVPTSEATARQARDLQIPLINLSDCPLLDLAIDGADEIDPHLNLIKGLGRALLREKIVEIHANRFIVIADESKMVAKLGTRGPLPVEIVPFEKEAHLCWLEALASRVELMREPDGEPVITENGNFLALCHFERGIDEPYALALALAQRPGIVEHGLFLGMADMAIVAGAQGVQIMERAE